MPIRLARTDTYGHSSQASAVRTTFCGSLVSGKWLAVPIPVPLSTKRKIKREQHESVKSRSPTKEVCPYMPIRLARTDTYGHSSQASAVRTTFCGSLVSGKWLAVPIPVPLSTKRKIKREQHESVKSRSPTKEVCPYMPIRLARTDTYGHSSQASAVRTTFCGSLVSGKWLAVPIPVPLSTRNRRRKW